VDEVGPEFAGVGAAVRRPYPVHFPHSHRDEVLDAEAEQPAERGRVAAEPDVVALVHDAGEERHYERPAARDELSEVLGGFVADEVEVWGDDQLVGGEIRAGMGEVHGNVRLEERLVEGIDAF